MPGIAAVVVAAGQGVRVGGTIPKQFRKLGGQSMLRLTLARLLEVPKIAAVQPVTRPEDAELVREAMQGLTVRSPVAGGLTRQDSVRAGLEALKPLAPDIVLVHDSARPFASVALIERAIEAAQQTGAAIPGVPVTDTVK